MMRKSRWLGFAILLAIAAISFVALFLPRQPLAASGVYAVGTERYTYTDDQRTEPYSNSSEFRQVNVTCWYPQNESDGETFPLIIFSHGGLGTENSNESLYRELASHGYVVCSIGHPQHALWTKSKDGHLTFVSLEYFGELQREDAYANKEQSYRYYQKWMNIRTADINFVVDTLLTKAAEGTSGVYTLIDSTKIGVMGHSLGGSAALAIPRQREDIDAVIALESPFLYDIVGVENGEFIWLDEEYPVPVLNIYSDSSWSHLAEWPQYARNASLLTNALSTAISIYLPGRGHFSLTDLSLASPLLTRILDSGRPARDNVEYLREVNQICLNFFDHFLKNQTVEIRR
ncbi:MAG: hypothetical protein KatS3mg046_772 [Bellilinea sp.]|nr:MAG: hypothetical protein KatS3mg046_772 [Bellilinea sp.]